MTEPPSERYESLNGVALFVREVGSGPPVIVVHGGPDFDHFYLRPELDRLAQACRLVYYDQRGRGRSAGGVHASEVSIDSELADLDALRRSLGLSAVAVLGHSWGGLLAMEYAVRFPGHVSHLILMNSAPASSPDWQLLRRSLQEHRTPDELARMQLIAASSNYRDGDLAAEAEYYRIHFRPTVRDPTVVDLIVARLRAHFTAATVRLARDIEDRLYAETCARADYDLLPRLRDLRVPALVLHGGDDVIPSETAAHIAGAIAGADFVVLAGCGHFSFVENPGGLHQHITALLDGG